MPEMSGTQLIQEIENTKSIKNPHILVLSGAVPEDVLKMKETGRVDQILNKPLHFEDIARAIEQIQGN